MGMQKPLHSPKLALGVDIALGKVGSGHSAAAEGDETVTSSGHFHSSQLLVLARLPCSPWQLGQHRPVRNAEPWVVVSVFQLPLCLLFLQVRVWPLSPPLAIAPFSVSLPWLTVNTVVRDPRPTCWAGYPGQDGAAHSSCGLPRGLQSCHTWASAQP